MILGMLWLHHWGEPAATDSERFMVRQKIGQLQWAVDSLEEEINTVNMKSTR
jgi:hypothetical protein